jgi:hypothetical protein
MTFVKGCTPWHKGKKLPYRSRPGAIGRIPWNKGMKIGDKCRKKKLYKGSVCLQCNTIFYSYPSEKKKYCSASCRSIYTKAGYRNKGKKFSAEYREKLSIAHIGIQADEKHPNWQGGRTSFDKRERGKFNSRLRKKVFEKDQHKCVLCGGCDNLHVDHIKPWAKYPELRFELSNCRTLCAKCHYKVTFDKEAVVSNMTWGSKFVEVDSNV